MGCGSDDYLISEPLWFCFGQLGLAGATGALTCATFFLLVPPGDERGFPRPDHLVPVGGRRGSQAMGTKSFFLFRAYCGDVPTHLPGVSTLAEKERASQASQLVVVGSSLQPFLYKLEDTGNLQLLEILRNVLSQPAAEFRGSVSPQKCQVLTPGGFKNTRKATQDRTFQDVADATKHMSLLLNK